MASTSTPGGDRPVAAAGLPAGAARHLLVAVCAGLPGGGRGGRGPGGAGRRRGWLALHLVLLGAATNAIVVWSEHFAAARCGRHRSPSGWRRYGRSP